MGSATVVFLYFYLFYQVLVAGLRSNSRFVCTSVSPSFFAGLSNGGEYRCGDWTVAVKRYSASVLSQGGTSLVMAITSLDLSKEEKPLPENTIKPRLELACRQALVLVFTIEIVFGIQPKVVEVVDSCNVLLNNKLPCFV